MLTRNYPIDLQFPKLPRPLSTGQASPEREAELPQNRAARKKYSNSAVHISVGKPRDSSPRSPILRTRAELEV